MELPADVIAEIEGGVGRILILITGVGVIYGLYNYFT